MASQKREEDIQCEYVYDEKKSVAQQEASIFTREYSEEDSEKDVNEPHVQLNTTSSKRTETSKTKRRNSRYDENMYALPDSDEEAEMTSMKAKLQTRENQIVTQKHKLLAWRTAFFVSISILLLSVTGNVYLTVKKVNSRGK